MTSSTIGGWTNLLLDYYPENVICLCVLHIYLPGLRYVYTFCSILLLYVWVSVCEDLCVCLSVVLSLWVLCFCVSVSVWVCLPLLFCVWLCFLCLSVCVLYNMCTMSVSLFVCISFVCLCECMCFHCLFLCLVCSFQLYSFLHFMSLSLCL